MPECYICHRDESQGHSLTTTDNEEVVCGCHLIEGDGNTLCPEHLEALLNTDINSVLTWIRARHESPPTLTTVAEVAAELVSMCQKLDDATRDMLLLHENQKRIKTNARVI